MVNREVKAHEPAHRMGLSWLQEDVEKNVTAAIRMHRRAVKRAVLGVEIFVNIHLDAIHRSTLGADVFVFSRVPLLDNGLGEDSFLPRRPESLQVSFTNSIRNLCPGYSLRPSAMEESGIVACGVIDGSLIQPTSQEVGSHSKDSARLPAGEADTGTQDLPKLVHPGPTIHHHVPDDVLYCRCLLGGDVDDETSPTAFHPSLYPVCHGWELPVDTHMGQPSRCCLPSMLNGRSPRRIEARIHQLCILLSPSVERAD